MGFRVLWLGTSIFRRQKRPQLLLRMNDWGAGDPAAVAAAIGVRHAAAMAATPEGYTGQAYGGGWSTWRQRRGFIHVEDHTKQVE